MQSDLFPKEFGEIRCSSFPEVRELLESRGYRYLGCVNRLDCWVHYWLKQDGDRLYLAEADGWLGNWTPFIWEIRSEELQRLLKRIDED